MTHSFSFPFYIITLIVPPPVSLPHSPSPYCLPDPLRQHIDVLPIKPLITEVDVTVAQQDAPHIVRSALSRGIAQQHGDDGLVESVSKGEVLGAVVTLGGSKNGR